ncbi:hypothetical protein LZ31DRAFT_625159 [Colletotrichum somersetense]|nr:hypothetical protein LZ31DRAFT_625159 [Colletotrichum somersetense]
MGLSFLSLRARMFGRCSRPPRTGKQKALFLEDRQLESARWHSFRSTSHAFGRLGRTLLADFHLATEECCKESCWALESYFGSLLSRTIAVYFRSPMHDRALRRQRLVCLGLGIFVRDCLGGIRTKSEAWCAGCCEQPPSGPSGRDDETGKIWEITGVGALSEAARRFCFCGLEVL